MARPPRDTSAGLFHVWTHGLWVVPLLYRDDHDRIEFLRHLAYSIAKTESTCVAYSIMSNHYHLILKVDDGALPVAMQIVNRRYARYFNRTHGLRGHAFGERYGSRRIEDGLDLLDTFTYVARQSLKAGVYTNPADDPWSSYAATVGLAEASSFVDASAVLNAAGRLAGDPAAALRRRVEGPVPGTGL